MYQTSRLNISNADLVKFLSSTTTNASFVEKLKIKYRPYVCPFSDLLDYAVGVDSVFDIGAGSGQFCSLVGNYTDASRIKGIEITQRLVDNAQAINAEQSQVKSISFSLFDGTTIPDDIAAYDLIYMIDVYHHIPVKIRTEFMEQVYTKMKPGARIMFKDIDAASPFVLFNKVHDLIFAHEIGNEMSNNDALVLFKSLGFNVLENHKRRIFVYAHYFVLAQK